MKKVAIIGLGWLGLPLALELMRSGMAVVGSKTTSDGVNAARMSGIDCYQLRFTPDIECEAPDLEQLMNATDVLVIMLPVNKTEEGGIGYLKAVQLLVDTVLSYAIPRIIFTSSTSVYGTQSGTLNEDAKLYPNTEEGKTLVKVENWLHQLPNISVDILRLAGLVGEARHAGRFLAGKTALTGGNEPVNLIHQDDIITAIKLLILRPEGGNIYNLCAPEHPVRSSYYTMASQRVALQPPEFIAESTPMIGKIIDGSRICKELGFEYNYPDPTNMPMTL